MMKEEYKLKIIDKSDVDDVVLLVRLSFNSEHLSASIYRGNGINNYIENELSNPFSRYCYLGLYKEDMLVGFAEFKLFNADKISFLNIIAIKNEFKRSGAGTILFEKSKNYFRNKGFQFIELDVYETNRNALIWYKKLGFEIRDVISCFKISINETTDLGDFTILNLPQYQVVNKSYGFYFLNIFSSDTSFSIGVIDNDLFVRNLNIDGLENIVFQLKKYFGFQNVYYLGKNCPYGIIEEKNDISRMILKIK